jgi:hypothetical protein
MTGWLGDLWWSRVPSIAGRLSPSARGLLSEGVYLTAARRISAYAPAVALLLGLLAGSTGFGGDVVFTQSYAVLLLAIVLGMVAGVLGAYFTVGYGLGDLLLGGTPATLAFDVDGPVDRALLVVALLIAYAALGMLAAGIPLAVQGLRAQAPWAAATGDARALPDIALGALLSGALVFVYVQALPMLVRPVFTWQGDSPVVEAVAPVQQYAWLLALAALIVAALRVLAEHGAVLLGYPEIERRAAALDARQASSQWERTPAPVRVLLAAGLGTLTLSGMVTAWPEAFVLFSGLVMVNGLRTLAPRLVPAWPRLIERIPVLVRLPVAVVLGLVLSAQLLAGQLRGTSFLPLIWALLLSLLCFAVLFPHPPGAAPGRPPSHSRPAT